LASKPIEAYKKAYAIDPQSRSSASAWRRCMKAQRVHDADWWKQ